MEMSTFNAASANGAAHLAQMNSAGAHAFQMAATQTLVPPGNTIGECTNFVFSEGFRKFINVSRDAPPLTIVKNVNDYMSSCVCKVYNETFPTLKDKPSNVFKYADPYPPSPPKYSDVYSVVEIQPIVQNISYFFFKSFIPWAEKEHRDNNTMGRSTIFGINFLRDVANTLIGFDLSHDYAKGSDPAVNILDAHVRCSGMQIGWANADPRMVDLIKNLCIQHFKKMGVKVYLNDKII